MMRGFIRDQLRDNVNVLRPSPGTKLDALSHPDPVTLKHDHCAWLQTALIRTGWVSNDSEQLAPPNGHRAQTLAAFFGQTHTSNPMGSASDLSDVDSRDDEESLSSNPLDDDDIMSTSDMDPFALSSSYSSEADGNDIESPNLLLTDNAVLDPPLRPNLEIGQDMVDSQTSLRDHSAPGCSVPASVTCHPKTSVLESAPPNGQSDTSCAREDHADTPTPPALAKRLVFPTPHGCKPDSGNFQPYSKSSTVTRPTTMKTSLDKDMGFSENLLSPLAVESTTPTADIIPCSATPLYTKVATLHRNSAGAESSCSSTTSFFSTGSAGLSSARSADCSPTGDQLLSKVIPARVSGSTHPYLDKPDGQCVDSSPWPEGSSNANDSVHVNCGTRVHMKRVAPLAEDEIGDQTIRQKGECSPVPENVHAGLPSPAYPSNPPTEANLPTWAVGRPHGASIHQGNQPESEQGGRKSPNKYSVAPGLSEPGPPTPLADNRPDDSNTCTGVSSDAGGSPDLGNSSEIADFEDGEPGDSATADEEEDGGDEEEQFDDMYEISDDNGSNKSTKFRLEDYWMTAEQLVKHVEEVGVSGLHSEYAAIVKIKSEDPRSAFKHSRNQEKNRYCDVVCYESSRVHLRPSTLQVTVPPSSQKSAVISGIKSVVTHLHRTRSAPTAAKDLVRNYIHANWVDGYRQKNAFICTQGPLAETAGDFWQMIWDYHIPVIVMITKIYEAERFKCYPYWPKTLQQKLYFKSGVAGTMRSPPADTKPMIGSNQSSRSPLDPDFEIENSCSKEGDHFTCSTLRLTHLPSGEQRTVEHFAYFSWPDHGVPQTTSGLRKLLSSVHSVYVDSIGRLGYSSYMDQEVPPPPVVVHCSAGIGRTGTYVTTDICTKWLSDSENADKRINVPLTVTRVRSQRFGCVQVAAQYVFCYRVLIDFAVDAGLIEADVSQNAVDLLTPSSDHLQQSSTSFYQSASLPKPLNPFGSSASNSAFVSSIYGTNTLAAFRKFLPSAQILSHWDVIRSQKNDALTSDSINYTNFIMTENICSDSDSNRSDLDSPDAADHGSTSLDAGQFGDEEMDMCADITSSAHSSSSSTRSSPMVSDVELLVPTVSELGTSVAVVTSSETTEVVCNKTSNTTS
ncbi:unnamed protein product [Calicophoron daubneyi]|uniref:Tyrosine-protein phosphatase non-receptor type 9 n=1 Tax=Calicophoron daubneyi TaxID=300641 RepID=A0AAV2TRR8_CALDB